MNNLMQNASTETQVHAAPAPQLRKNTAELLMRVLVFTLIISSMNANMFTIVLPTISTQFLLSPSQVSWVITSYMIVYAVGTVTFGKLTDKYRLKDLLTFGLLFFVLGSILGLMASEYWMIVAGRVVQAAGASVIPATAMIVPIRYFSPEKRGRALGTSAIGIALGTAMGPIVAGLIISAWSWRVLFALPLLSLLTLPFYRKYLNDPKGTGGTIDFTGGALLAATVTAVLLALTNANAWYALTGAVALLLFVLRIRFAENPFIQPAIFRNKHHSSGLAIGFVMTAMSFSIPYLIPQLLTNVNDMLPASTGLVMLPSAIVTALLGRRGGKLADEKGNPFLVYTAAALLFIGFLSFSSVVGLSPLWIGFFMIFGVLGQSFMQIAMSNTVSRTLTKEQAGTGMGLFSMITFISGASSTAVIGKILDFGIPSSAFNPIPQNRTAFIYSNIFLLLAFMVVAMALIYFMRFGRGEKS